MILKIGLFKACRSRRFELVFFISVATLAIFFISVRPSIYTASATIAVNRSDRNILRSHKNIIGGRWNAYNVFRKLKLYRIERFKRAKDPAGILLEDVRFKLLNDGELLKITARSINPRLAAYIANEFAMGYLDSRLNRSQVNGAWIQHIADVPHVPVGLDKRIVLVVTVILAFLGAIGVGFLRRKKHDFKKSRSDKISLAGLPVLGVVPNIRINGGALLKEEDKFFTVKNNLHSMACESYNSIRKNLLFSLRDSHHGTESILITSPASREGKTMTAVNLAAICANSGERVLLVDANIRSPRIHSIFRKDNKLGFFNFLSRDLDFERMIKSSEIDNLHLVTSGRGLIRLRLRGPMFPQRLKIFLKKAESRFSKIIFDASHMMRMDVGMLPSVCTGTVLVSRNKARAENYFDDSGKFLKKRTKNMIGVILNNVEVAS